MQYIQTATYILAVAYGEGAYACADYNQGCESNPANAPDTGFFSLPPEVLYPLLFGIAIVLGVTSYAISRMIKKYKNKTR